MLTAVEIENFKGIRERVRVEFRPVTLLFGPNSSGKSTILHALHYAHEIFERHNLDADRTIAGGPFIDLGGFGSFVHQKDLARPVALRLDFERGWHSLPTYSFVTGEGFVGRFIFEEPPDLSDDVERGSVEIAVAWSPLREALYVREYSVSVNGTLLATVTADPGHHAVTAGINWGHPLLARLDEGSPIALAIEVLAAQKTSGVPVERQMDALPTWGQAIPLVLFPDGGDELAEALPDSIELRTKAANDLLAALSQLIVGPGELVRDWLQGLRYLGPIRESPGRSYSPPRTQDPSRWACGIGAWDELTHGADELVQQVSNWLSHPDRFNTGYRVERRRYKRLDLADPLVLALASGRAFDEADQARINLNRLPTETQIVIVSEENKLDLLPPDVGIGISQILPVVVASADREERLVAIEQPELHVHPRIQAELGDLFIETAVGGPHRYLIETHSEHLILRILRRIRETGDGKPHNGVAVTGDQVAVYYLSVEQGQARLRKIDIDKRGEFVQPWPDDFFEIDFYERFGDAR